MAEPLAVESRTFEQNLPDWRLKHVGKFVLIKGTEVVGFFDSLDSAANEGFKRFGVQDFFIDQVRPESVTNVTFLGQYHFQVH